MNRMTELKELCNYRKNKEVPVVRMRRDAFGDYEVIIVEEPEFVNGPYGVSDKITHRYITGPIVERLYEYERLGMEPEEITEKLREQTKTIVKYRIEEEALRMKIGDLKEELQSTYRDLEDAEERDNVKALTIDELRNELTYTKRCVADMACGSNDLVTQYSEQLKTKNIENDKLRKEIDELKKCNAYLEGARLGAKHLQDKLYDDIHAIAEERDAVIEKNGTLAKRIGELEDIVSRFSNDKVIREKEIKKLQEELAHRDKQNEELFKENKAFESMLSKAEQQRDFYMRRTSDYDRLKERIAKQDKQIDKYDLVIHTIEQLFGCAFDI